MEFIDFILHVDHHLNNIIQFFGPWTYAIIFGIIFAETGLVVTPFLPGDSLLFAIGALAGSGFLNIWVAYATLMAAAILGDSFNYWIGRMIGPRVFSDGNSRFFKKAYLEKTREYYAKHGGKTVILARFLPILRTFAPFVAGIGKMHYRDFLFFSVVGTFAWVTSLVGAGYLFGGLPFVKENFETVVIGIIVLSVSPMIIEYFRHKRGPKLTEEQLSHATYGDIKETFEKEHLSD